MGQSVNTLAMSLTSSAKGGTVLTIWGPKPGDAVSDNLSMAHLIRCSAMISPTRIEVRNAITYTILDIYRWLDAALLECKVVVMRNRDGHNVMVMVHGNEPDPRQRQWTKVPGGRTYVFTVTPSGDVIGQKLTTREHMHGLEHHFYEVHLVNEV